jgi:hypothetical protein
MKRFLTVLAVVCISGGIAFAAEDKAADKKKGDKSEAKAKTVSGKSSCATCDGLPVKGHKIMLTADDGTRWVLEGDNAAYKAAHKVRKDDKKMTATLASEPVTKKDDSGKEYKEAKISAIKVEEEKKA